MTLAVPVVSQDRAKRRKPKGPRECVCCGTEFPLVAPTIVTCPDCRAARRHRCLKCDTVFTGVGKEKICATCNPPLPPEVAAYLRYLDAEKGRSPNTLKAYARDLSDFCRYLGQEFPEGWTWSTIDRAVLRRFLGSLHARGLCKRSTARAVPAIRGFLDFLLGEDTIATNPARRMRTPKWEKRLTQCPSRHQMETVFAKAEQRDGFFGVRDLAMLETFYSTGMRLAELVGIDVADLDLLGKHVKVMGKGRKERILPLGDPAVRALRRWLAIRENALADARTDAVFISTCLVRISPREVQRLMRRLLHAAGITGMRVHSFRHAAATHMLDAGANLRVIAELLGHASLSSTQVYTSVSVERLKRAYHDAHLRA